MSRLYIYLLGITGLALAATGAFFSIFGLSQLFAGAAKYIIFMAGALEFAKLVSAGFLYRYWGHINAVLRTYMVGTVLTLIGITSLGIFGFLSNAYQKSSFTLHTQQLKMENLVNEGARYEKHLQEIQTFMDSIPANRVSKRFEFQKKYEHDIKSLKKQHDAVETKIATLKLDQLQTQTDVGPIIYTAEALGVGVDTVAKYLILIFVLVFDPLAVCLVFCWNLAVRLQEKYRGDEEKIANRTMMGEPIDHRFRKHHRKAA